MSVLGVELWTQKDRVVDWDSGGGKRGPPYL